MHPYRRKLASAGLAAVILLAGSAVAGCGKTGKPTAGAGDALISPFPGNGRTDWCGLDLSRRDQRDLFVDRLGRFLDGRTAEQAVAERRLFDGGLDCVRWEQAPGGRTVLVGVLGRGWFAAARSGRSWRVSDLGHLDADHLRVLGVSDDGREMLVEQLFSGSGGGGGLMLLRFLSDGAAEIPFRTGYYEQVQFQRLRPDLILVTYRGNPGGPVAWEANCCIPVANQILWRWRNGRFDTLGERRMADPYYTASRFFGALARGDDGAAAAWTTDPALVAQVRQALGPGLEGPIPAWYADPTGQPVRRIEERNWEALPPEFRRALPPELREYTMVMRNGGQTARLVMKRLPEGWRVAGVSR